MNLSIVSSSVIFQPLEGALFRGISFTLSHHTTTLCHHPVVQLFLSCILIQYIHCHSNYGPSRQWNIVAQDLVRLAFVMLVGHFFVNTNVGRTRSSNIQQLYSPIYIPANNPLRFKLSQAGKSFQSCSVQSYIYVYISGSISQICRESVDNFPPFLLRFLSKISKLQYKSNTSLWDLFWQ